MKSPTEGLVIELVPNSAGNALALRIVQIVDPEGVAVARHRDHIAVRRLDRVIDALARGGIAIPAIGIEGDVVAEQFDARHDALAIGAVGQAGDDGLHLFLAERAIEAGCRGARHHHLMPRICQVCFSATDFWISSFSHSSCRGPSISRSGSLRIAVSLGMSGPIA